VGEEFGSHTLHVEEMSFLDERRKGQPVLEGHAGRMRMPGS